MKTEDFEQAMQIILHRHPGLLQSNNEVLDIDFDPLDSLTLRQLAAFCHFCLKGTNPEFNNAWPGLLFGAGAHPLINEIAVFRVRSMHARLKRHAHQAHCWERSGHARRQAFSCPGDYRSLYSFQCLLITVMPGPHIMLKLGKSAGAKGVPLPGSRPEATPIKSENADTEERLTGAAKDMAAPVNPIPNPQVSGEITADGHTKAGLLVVEQRNLKCNYTWRRSLVWLGFA